MGDEGGLAHARVGDDKSDDGPPQLLEMAGVYSATQTNPKLWDVKRIFDVARPLPI